MTAKPGQNKASGTQQKTAAAHRTAAALAVVAGLMLGASFAAVPLYRLFCAATGYGGTTQSASRAPDERGLRKIAVRFDANVAPGLAWRFEPETPEILLRPGETVTVFFRAANLSDRATEGVARFNVAPDQAGAWFDKLKCFCFDAQKLGPHETAEWPVVFFLDPKLEQDETMAAVDAITLSYTFFAPPGAKRNAETTGAADIAAVPGKS
ncbi:cytochrome c oxidase assembly protein [Rhodoblastus sp. 17X3]|uniref:cytochrome c oxidase assembly protein n=1 Tax=Rhodoblastus sp. 17X3 TaxID=3047026 RepID=UPI0024B8375F|nr:cytochrome c oxidase assembly protein [Rhodoblastus sp. 17X3]MDI9848485.1 cytochrome c oxidase assembly protein [Rhodoblastus sp. 17X3]